MSHSTDSHRIGALSRLSLVSEDVHAPDYPVSCALPISPLLFSPRELPGTYYRGDGLGANTYLRLTPDYRFRLSESGHASLEDNEIARGRWQLNGDLVRLLPERRNRRNNDEARQMQICFVPIKWEQRLYLIDEHETPAFCNLASTHSWHTNHLLNERRPFFDYLKLHWPNTAPKGYDEGREQPYPPPSRRNRLSPSVRVKTI